MCKRVSIVTAVAIGIATLTSVANAGDTSSADTTEEAMESCNPLLDDNEYVLPSATLIVDDPDMPTSSLPKSPKVAR